MRLGEALSERARLQRKIGDLRSRINSNAQAQEEVLPAEDPQALLSEVEQTHTDLASLIARINHTNAQTAPSGVTLTSLLAERDRLSGLINTYTQAAQAGQIETGGFRYARSELKRVSAVDVKDLRKKADDASAELRTLDNEIQETNWNTDLI